MIQGWIEKIKRVVKAASTAVEASLAPLGRGEWLLGLMIFLMVTFSFGLGWIIASQQTGRAPIIINCPAQEEK